MTIRVGTEKLQKDGPKPPWRRCHKTRGELCGEECQQRTHTQKEKSPEGGGGVYPRRNDDFSGRGNHHVRNREAHQGI